MLRSAMIRHAQLSRDPDREPVPTSVLVNQALSILSIPGAGQAGPESGLTTGASLSGSGFQTQEEPVRTPEPQPEWGPARSRAVQWWDPSRTAAEAAGRSGLEFMQALADGKIPPPPIAMLCGMFPTRIERGLAQFECLPDESAYNPIGVVHGGLVRLRHRLPVSVGRPVGVGQRTIWVG